MLRAEDVYTALLQENGRKVRPGAGGSLEYAVEGRTFRADWEVRQNAVWRRGRVFLRCVRCSGRCTRLYLPLADLWLACRRCWGLTYSSKTLQNYKDSLWGRGSFAKMWRTSQRDWAFLTTDERRKERRRKSRQRWAARRSYLSPKHLKSDERVAGCEFGSVLRVRRVMASEVKQKPKV